MSLVPSECVRVTKTLPLSLTHMPTGPSPLQELATGIRRILTPPAPTQHTTVTIILYAPRLTGLPGAGVLALLEVKKNRARGETVGSLWVSIFRVSVA